MKSDKILKKLIPILKTYDAVVKGLDAKARFSENRAYGGIVRAGKGRLVESIAKELIKIAWENLKKGEKELSFVSQAIKIPMKREYLKQIKNLEVRKYLKENIQKMYYRINPDLRVYVDGEFKVSVECKAYAENAMLKRILVDCTLLKHIYPNLFFVLFQLESQLGGDFSLSTTGKYGSPPTHTLLSYFDIDLNIITLIEGERKVGRPIHKPQYYKPLEVNRLLQAIELFKRFLVK